MLFKQMEMSDQYWYPNSLLVPVFGEIEEEIWVVKKSTIEYTDIKWQCYAPEIYIVLLTNFTSIKRKKEKQLYETLVRVVHLYPNSNQNTISLLNGANKFNLKNW